MPLTLPSPIDTVLSLILLSQLGPPSSSTRPLSQTPMKERCGVLKEFVMGYSGHYAESKIKGFGFYNLLCELMNIIWTGFKESCTAKVIQKTANSSPHSGQAFVIFKKKEAAESVVRKLEDGCLLMSNGRPLVGSIGVPCFPKKKPIFYGHYVVDQLRMMQMQREMKDAVSTSHCSQPNNIEYDMAIEWYLLQEKANESWRRLYQRQGEELSKLKAKLKSKI
ncbi:hypothetical protein VNO78_01069 [Psophocarpus tetragonolobus]|uniref:RRM domain-containing protein n=1 Tax=Psophocarpus tetragonolobus TaxID=3891 RepID=A0AAN9T8U4_PSOTE